MKQNKSIIAVILVLLILVSLCACINNNDAEVEDELNTSNISMLPELTFTEPTHTTSIITSSNEESSETASSSLPTQNSPESTSSTQISTQYTPKPKDPEKLSADTEKKIKEDYVAWWNKSYEDDFIEVSDVMIIEYYGTYSGGETVMIAVDGYETPCVVEEKNIAGYNIWFPSGGSIYIHKDVNFYSIEDAYNKGLITKRDVRDIKWYLNDVKELEQ